MVSNPFQDGVSVQISGDSSGLENALSSATASLADFKKKVGMASGALAAFSGVAIAGVVNEARKFEDVMADVQKVTSPGVSEELHDRLMDLAEDLPIAREELAATAEQAGKFGAEAADEIMKFVETVGMLQVATDLTAEEAGKRFAKIADVIGLPLSEVRKLGDATNELSDSMKTDADEITDTATRAGNTLAQQLGLGEDAVLGFAASMNEVSSSSRLAGSSLRRMGQVLMDPRKVEDIAGALNMNVEEFRRMRDEEPEKLFKLIAREMANSGETAQELRPVLGKAGEGFSKLGENLDRVDRAQGIVNEQFEEGGSLQKEMNIRTETLSGQLQMLKDQIRNVATVIGEQLLPVVKGLVDLIASAVDIFARWNKKTDGAVAALGLVTTAIGGLVIAAGTLLPVFSGVATVLGAVTTALGAVTLPIVAVGAAIAGLAIAWQQNLFGIRDKTETVFNEFLKPAFETLATVATRVFNDIKAVVQTVLTTVWDNFIVPFTESVTKVWREHSDTLKQEAQETWAAIQHAIDILQRHVWPVIKQFIDQAQSAWNKWGDEILAFARFVFDEILIVVETILDGMLTALGIGMDLIQGDWEEAWEKFKGFHERLLGRILDFIEKWELKEILMGAVNGAIGAIEDLESDFRDAGEALIDAFIDALEKKADEVEESVKGAVDTVRSYFPGSDAEQGPLSDLTAAGEALPETFAEGIEGNLQATGGAAALTAQAAVPAAQGGGGDGGVTIHGGINVDASGADDPQAVGTAVANELRSVLQR